MSLIARTYTDLDLNFEAHPITKDILKRTDVRAITGSLSNLLQTSHYERLFHPAIGTNLRKILFEPMDNISSAMLKDEVDQVIRNYEPRVTLEGVEVFPDYDNQKYDVTITFFIVNRADPITITLFLYRVR